MSDWKSNRKGCAARRRVGRGERSAMLGDDAVGEGEADAVAFRFGGEKWDEDALHIFGRDAVAGVADVNARPRFTCRLALTRPAHFDESLLFLFVNRFGGVAQKVKERWAEHSLVGLNLGKLALDFN